MDSKQLIRNILIGILLIFLLNTIAKSQDFQEEIKQSLRQDNLYLIPRMVNSRNSLRYSNPLYVPNLYKQYNRLVNSNKYHLIIPSTQQPLEVLGSRNDMKVNLDILDVKKESIYKNYDNLRSDLAKPIERSSFNKLDIK